MPDPNPGLAPRRASRARAGILAVGLSACLNVPARGHVFTVTEVLAVLKSDGTYQIDMNVDVDALALGVPSASDSRLVAEALLALSDEELAAAMEQARSTILRRTEVRFNGEKVTSRVTFPDHGLPPADPALPTVLGITARLTGNIPPSAKTFSFFASRAFAAVNLTVLDQTSLGGVRYLLGPGEESPSYPIGLPAGAATSPSIGRYLVLGFEHIIPEGLDHVLFVLGLFLLSARLGPLLWQVTAFTVAHSITLGLAMYEIVDLPSRVVEPLIALSIAYVAVENLATSELKPWRPAVVFLFGLLHGLGFAGVLRDLGLPQSEFAAALVLFNVGVELGQLAVIALAMLAVGWLQGRSWYRKAIVIPASSVIAATGLYWAVTRTWAA